MFPEVALVPLLKPQRVSAQPCVVRKGLEASTVYVAVALKMRLQRARSAGDLSHSDVSAASETSAPHAIQVRSSRKVDVSIDTLHLISITLSINPHTYMYIYIYIYIYICVQFSFYYIHIRFKTSATSLTLTG